MSNPADFTSESWRCRWVCPDLRPLSAKQAASFAHVFSSMKGFEHPRTAGFESFGLEAKTAFVALGAASELKSAADNQYWTNKCQMLFVRPAIEPLAVSYWNKLTSLDLDINDAQKIVSALTMSEQALRSREGVGRSPTGKVGFEPPERAVRWLDRLKAASAQPAFTDAMPAYAFASTIMAHPFIDGNGRLARLLMLGALGQRIGWKAPAIALAPSFYRHAETLGRALDTLSTTGRWDDYFAIFLHILNDAIDLTTLLGKRAAS